MQGKNFIRIAYLEAMAYQKLVRGSIRTFKEEFQRR
jgi:hypothetical protein